MILQSCNGELVEDTSPWETHHECFRSLIRKSEECFREVTTNSVAPSSN